MHSVIVRLVVLFGLIFGAGFVEARSGCCSSHGGVQSNGCGCNDGTSLSATCAPYYSCSITTVKVSQNISFGTAPTLVISGTGTVSATATSGLAVTYNSTTPTICTVFGSTVTGIAVGACTITANQAGNASYYAAPQATQTITVGKASQTISFGTAPSVAVGGTASVSATATSSLAVAYTSATTGICTASGSTVTGVAAGTCTIAANQIGNATYAAASQVTQNITVTLAPINGACGSANGVTVSAIPAANLCTTGSASAVAGSVPWIWSCNGSNGGTNASCSAPVAIMISNQTISFGSAPSVIIGSTGTVSATGGASGNAVTFSSTTQSVCTISGSTITGIGAGTCIIAADQAGDATYSAATQVTQTINIGAVSNVASFMGLWYNPAESGWGMSVTQHDTINFVAMYTYDQNAQPVWYVMSNCPIVTAGSCTGDIYKVTGGSVPTSTWAPNLAVTTAGTGTLTFSDTNNGKFDFTLNGVAGSKTIQRQRFSSGTAAQAVDYSDLWWNASESGWGVALIQDMGMIFAAWYTYDAAGLPVWYVASSCPLSGSGCTGDVYKVTGGTAPTSAWSSKLAVTKVGSVTFAFSDSGTGTMSYTIGGVAGSKAIVRQAF